MSCAKMKVLFMSFVFCMLSVLGKIFARVCQKEGGGFMPVFTTHYIQEETEKYGAK